MCLAENKGPLFGISESCVIAIIWFMSIDTSGFFPLVFAEPLSWSHTSFLLSRLQVCNERTVWWFSEVFLYFLNSSDDQLLFLAAIRSIILNILKKKKNELPKRLIIYVAVWWCFQGSIMLFSFINTKTNVKAVHVTHWMLHEIWQLRKALSKISTEE